VYVQYVQYVSQSVCCSAGDVDPIWRPWTHLDVVYDVPHRLRLPVLAVQGMAAERHRAVLRRPVAQLNINER